jgi:hypothetical protein
MVSTQPTSSHCDDLFAFYKLLQWMLTSELARSQTSEAGYAPLSPPIYQQILATLGKITCNRLSVYNITPIDNRGALQMFLLVLTSFVLIFVLFLSALHFYQFRATTINLVYTGVFVVGSILTLGSPYTWYLIPTKTSVCQARVWLSTIGISILLGTMFSRTWQLLDI